jgi:4-diphosphocytidyl-2-C-methyl-D-erythritol kinase
LGGGSADAAAALRLLVCASAEGAEGIAKTQAAEAEQQPDMTAYIPLAREIGADVPACLFSRAAEMKGVGERLRHLAPIAPVPAVLVNPMVPLATRDVFRELQAPPLPRSGEPAPKETPPLPEFANLNALLAYARAHPNHLEAPARRLLPSIGDVLGELANAPGAELARLSGSGPTCFALFRDSTAASAAAEAITKAHPGWWVCATTLQ